MIPYPATRYVQHAPDAHRVVAAMQVAPRLVLAGIVQQRARQHGAALGVIRRLRRAAATAACHSRCCRLWHCTVSFAFLIIAAAFGAVSTAA